MSLSLIDTLKKVYRTYCNFYNVTITGSFSEEQLYDESFDASLIKEGKILEAVFHMHSENYVFSKKAQIYQMDTNEYVEIYYYDHLNMELFDEVLAKTYEWGFPQIKPGPDHRSSYIGTIFICNTCDEDTLKALKKYRRRQSFQFSLHGWMEVHTALIELRSESVSSNSDGRQSGKFLKKILHPKRRWGGKIF